MRWLLVPLLLVGCTQRVSPPTSLMQEMEAAYQAQQAHKQEVRAETAEAKVIRIKGELETAKAERDEARLAGARRALNWTTAVLALLTIGAVVAACFMRSRTLGILAAACAAGAAAAQVFQKALDHIEVISWCTLAAAAIVGLVMIYRYHHD